ncbi:2,3-diaminopropionate biosynthesis protein SbnA, partial [Pseudomonas sp. 10B1]
MKFRHVEEILHDNTFLELENFTSGRNIYLKLEGYNPGGSIKMKTAYALIYAAEEKNDLKNKKKFIESSSGNLGVALSIISASKGYKFTCVVDVNTSRQCIETMRALNTSVVIIDTQDEQGGYLSNRFAYIRNAIGLDSDLIWLNQYENFANPEAHYKLTAKAIFEEFDQVDYLFVGTGTAGTLMGCAEFIRRHSLQTKLIAVDSEGSVTFGTPGYRRYLPGLGASVMPHFFNRNGLDRLIQIPEVETVAACRDSARRFGNFCGASTGTVLAAVKSISAEFPPDAVVVAISPDLGNTYVDTVYSDTWCDHTFGPTWRTHLHTFR